MNELLHTLGRGFVLGIIVCGLAMPAFGTVGNGDLVRVTADCTYGMGQYDTSSHALGTLDMALSSNTVNGPVYLTNGWEQSKGLAAGLAVRAFVSKDGKTVLANGIQLNDGRVMVDGQVLDRVDP